LVLGSEVGEDLTNSTAIAGECCESSQAEEGEGGGFGDGFDAKVVEVKVSFGKLSGVDVVYLN
jgi:hypothetical protein